MALSDVNWGAVIYGAGIATAIVACMGTQAAIFTAFGPIGGFIAAAAIGGIAGEFFSDITHKCGHAARVLAGATKPQDGHAV